MYTLGKKFHKNCTQKNAFAHTLLGQVFSRALSTKAASLLLNFQSNGASATSYGRLAL